VRRPQHRQIIARTLTTSKPHGLHIQQLRPANPGWPRSSGCCNRTSRPKPLQPKCLCPQARGSMLIEFPAKTTASVALEPRPRQETRRETARHSARLTEPVPCWFLSSTMCQTRFAGKALQGLRLVLWANQRRGGWCKSGCKSGCRA
jgi:hypothetical protein